jgi:pSer/pThr/pTyr-binding forkhead associated (FHA) protein
MILADNQDDQHTLPMPMEPTSVYTLEAVAADGRTLEFPLRQDHIIIGRSTQADLQIEDPQVSRQHLRLGLRGQLTLTDLGSTWGTTMDNERLPSNTPVPWQVGKPVLIGTPEEIVGAPADDYVAAFTRDVDRARVFTVDRVMTEPEALDLATDTPRTARRRMESLGRDALYVLDGDRVAGVARYRDLSGASDGNGGGLASALIRDYPSTGRGMPLASLYELCRSELPVAVVEGGRLLGVVEQGRVFDELAADRPAPAARERGVATRGAGR